MCWFTEKYKKIFEKKTQDNQELRAQNSRKSTRELQDQLDYEFAQTMTRLKQHENK